MAEKILYVISGCPGSGKSTWIRNEIAKDKDNKSICISRDEIRFSLVAEDEEYFSKEKEVFRKFVEKINEAIRSDEYETIYIDATHLNEASRNKVLDKLEIGEVDLYAVKFEIPLSKCLKQNDLRQGTRAYVPPDVIRKMYSRYNPPHFGEKYEYKGIYTISNL